MYDNQRLERNRPVARLGQTSSEGADAVCDVRASPPGRKMLENNSDVFLLGRPLYVVRGLHNGDVQSLVIAVDFGDADGGGVLEGADVPPDAGAAAGHPWQASRRAGDPGSPD